METVAEKIKKARTAKGKDLWSLLRDNHHEILLNATLNRNLTEDMAAFIAESRSAPSEALGFLSTDIRFKNSYKLKLAVCKNPKSPQKMTLPLLKFLRVFDLADLTKNQHIPVNLRQKIEQSLSERIPAMPSGVKTALAKRASSNIVAMLMHRGDRNVIDSCLDSPGLTEGALYKIILKASEKPLLIKAIAEHPKWSLRYDIRLALIRNFYTPMTYVENFICGMKTSDLRYLYRDPQIPASTRPFLYRELLGRNESADAPAEETYMLSGDEDSCLSDEEVSEEGGEYGGDG
ncbi:MAG: hypothetical protein Q8J64_08165 [Thermodesulfovibrionales bacterium]|nr:hypothetical protein [Thermodesulfovibrionales bacterium]